MRRKRGRLRTQMGPEKTHDEFPDQPDQAPEVAAALVAALAAASPHRPSPELRERVLRRAALRPRLLGLWRYAAVAVAAAMLAGGATWSLSPHPERVSAKADNADLAKLEATNEVVFDVISCKDGHLAVLRATQPGSMSYGKLYTCSASDDVVFMSGKLAPPGAGKEYELWLTQRGQTRLEGRLAVWPSLAGSGYYFGSITFKGGGRGPAYEFAELTLQAPNGGSPENPIVSWSAG